MPIREKGYYKWEGDLRDSGIRWLPMLWNGISAIYRKKFSKLLFTFSSFTFVLFFIAIYVSTRPELKMLKDIVKQIGSDAQLFNLFYTFPMLSFSIFLLCLFCESNLISGDLKFKSFTLYLSRPISKLDYILGKFSIVLFYLLLFTLIPGILLVITKIIFTGSFHFPFHVLLGIILYPILAAFFLASLLLMFSSLTANGKLAKIMFFVCYFLTNMVAEIFKDIFKNDYFQFLSFDANLRQFASFLFDTKPVFDGPTWLSGVIIVGLTLIFTFILTTRLKKVEV
jgi:ABC-type transport system involved in multi-copper enzyme maturation permease subunit